MNMKRILSAILLTLAVTALSHAATSTTRPVTRRAVITSKPASATKPADSLARLEKAKTAFVQTVGKATRDLRAEYDEVADQLKHAGDEESAKRIRDERDRVLAATTRPAVEGRAWIDDGWTILFRSTNPLLWNIEVNNGDDYSLPIKAVPAGMRYLRIRRMDTMDEVIIPCKRAELDQVHWPTPRAIFRGDKRLNRQACVVAILDPSHAVDHSQPLIALTPEGWYSGWGFAESGEGIEKQAWVWDGQSIGLTEMEIAVTDRPLRTTEEKHLKK